MEGVLKSFAIPKGFSFVPGDKHLAVRTEDHPLEYIEFEGVIPKGQYGAGTMTLWDRGSYELRGDADGLEGLEKGKLEVILRGGRLRGEWHLVKTAKGENDWLLFKSRDRYSRAESEAPFPLDLSRSRPSPFPKRFRAMLATEAPAAFSDPDWVFELCFSGLRLFAELIRDRVGFRDESGKRFRTELVEIVHGLRQLRCENALLDGVLVALDAQKRPDRELLDRRLAAGETAALTYYAFDLLYYEEWSTKSLDLVDRKRALASVLPDLDRVLYVDSVPERGDALFQIVQEGGLRGVIAKRARSEYRGGKSRDWIFVSAPASTPPRGDLLKKLAATPRARAGRARVTNRAKVYWPDEGITKGELIDYYDRIADYLLPHLRDRPVHLLRYPEGIEGTSFYQKKLDRQIPDWVETVDVGSDAKGRPTHYIICNDRDTLRYVVNLGSIDLHPWMSRRDHLDSPDWAVLDLDPAPGAFPQAIRLARAAGRLLRGAGLRPLVKTSGKSGLHVYLPLAPGYSYEQSRMFCEIVARLLLRDHGDIGTIERSVARRRGRVYLDYLQNRREQTVVPPYVVRPVKGATVSTPLEWDELRSGLEPSQFTIHNVPSRLEKLGDLFRDALRDGQDFTSALDALSEM